MEKKGIFYYKNNILDENDVKDLKIEQFTLNSERDSVLVEKKS